MSRCEQSALRVDTDDGGGSAIRRSLCPRPQSFDARSWLIRGGALDGGIVGFARGRGSSCFGSATNQSHGVAKAGGVGSPGRVGRGYELVGLVPDLPNGAPPA